MSEIDLQTLPPLLPADVQRTNDKGLPTDAQIDWEQFQQDWFKTQVVSLDTKLTTVSGSVGDLSGDVTDIMSVVENDDGSLTAQKLTTVTAKSDDAFGKAVDALSVVVNDDGTVTAGKLTDVSTTVGINTADILDLTTSVDGVKVQKVVKATLNGVTGGYEFSGVQNLDGTGATFAMSFNVNQFTLTDPAYNGGAPGNVFNYTGGIFTFNVPVVVDSINIADAAVKTDQIEVGAAESEDFLPLVTDHNIITSGSGTILTDLSKTFVVTENTTLTIMFNLAIRAVGSLAKPIAFTVGVYDSFVSTTTAVAYAFNDARSGQILEYGTHVGANVTTGNSGVFNMPPFIIPRLLSPGTHDIYVKVDFSYPFGAPPVPELIVRGDTQMFYRLKKR